MSRQRPCLDWVAPRFETIPKNNHMTTWPTARVCTENTKPRRHQKPITALTMHRQHVAELSTSCKRKQAPLNTKQIKFCQRALSNYSSVTTTQSLPWAFVASVVFCVMLYSVLCSLTWLWGAALSRAALRVIDWYNSSTPRTWQTQSIYMT